MKKTAENLIMKILLINKFLYPKGGDSISTLTTGALLKSKGHEVVFWGMKSKKNSSFPHDDLFVNEVDYNFAGGVGQQLCNAVNMLYSLEAKKKIALLLEKFKPDIVHLNNFAHQISPSILHVFKKYNIPCVMTMRDYKEVCPVYTMLLNGKPCERCQGGKFFNCLTNRCAKNSRMKSLLNAIEMYLHHKILHIYDLIDVFISPSMFLKNKTEEMGIGRTVAYLPNFVRVESFIPQDNISENSIVYVGRLSPEKGINTLISGVKGLEIKLKIIGDGPIKKELESRLNDEAIGNVCLMGYVNGNDLQREISKAMFLVIPSEWYENNPRSVIEAFALGKPAIGARIGGIPELVKDGETGFTFESGNTEDLRTKIQYLLNNQDLMASMGKRARQLVEEELNAEKHYERLIAIYKQAGA